MRKTWEIDPAITIYLAERFNYPAVQSEVARLVRSSTPDVLDVPEALRFLVGEKLDLGVQRDLRVCSMQIYVYGCVTDFILVSAAVGACGSCRCDHVLRAALSQPPPIAPIRSQGLGTASCRADVLLRASSRASPAL